MYYPSYIFVLQDHRLGDRTIWPSDFSADQLVGPLGSWFRRRPVGRTIRHSLLLGAHFVIDQLVGLLGTWFFANQLVRLSVASSLVPPGTRQLSWGLCLPIRLLAYYVLPTLHVMCDIKVFHAVQIRVLILGGTSEVWLVYPSQWTSAKHFPFSPCFTARYYQVLLQMSSAKCGNFVFTLNYLIMQQDVFYLTAGSGTKFIHFILWWMYCFSSYWFFS